MTHLTNIIIIGIHILLSITVNIVGTHDAEVYIVDESVCRGAAPKWMIPVETREAGGVIVATIDREPPLCILVKTPCGTSTILARGDRVELDAKCGTPVNIAPFIYAFAMTLIAGLVVYWYVVREKKRLIEKMR